MRFLNNFEIDNCCISIRDNVIKNHPQYTAHIKFLYLYGCRINELFNNRISFDGLTGNVHIIAQKNNNVRVNPMINSEVPELVEKIQLTQDNLWLNKRNLQRCILAANPYRSIFCGQKNIGAHLFRHNWIKKEVAAGKQISTINQMLGYTQQTVADTYLASKIHILT